MSRISYAQAKITNGTALSGEVDLRSHRIVGVHMPTGWDAAGLAFKGAVSGPGTGGAGGVVDEAFDPVVDSAGAEVVSAAAASKFITFTSVLRDELTGLARVKIVSGTNAVPVNQTADRLLVLCLEPRDGSLT